jgi:hypothetical protein
MYVFDKVAEITVALTVDTNAYSASDVVGGLITFAINSASETLLLDRIRLVDDDDEKAACKLYLFNDTPSTIADDAAFAPTVADLKKLVAIVEIAAADYTTLNSNAVAFVTIGEGELNIVKASNKGNLYGYLVCDATPTYTAAADLTLTLTALTQ